MNFESIFSLKDYGETHKILRIFGLKIKFPKSEFAKKKKESPYYYYKANNIDITTLPPATGQLRDIQLANLALLKELDYVCKQNGLKYWLDGGTLLGAVRHKGFVPWDDDIDVSMMRTDYLKLLKVFNESTRNPDLYADYVYLKQGQCIIKIMHKKCSLLFVDIFPCDYISGNADYSSRFKQSKEVRKYRKILDKDNNLNTIEKINSKIKEFNNALHLNSNEGDNVLCGLDYSYIRPVLVQPYDTIFPIKPLKFDGDEFMGVNKPDLYTKEIYGDYMAYPNKIGFGHSAYCTLTKQDKKVITELKNKAVV